MLLRISLAALLSAVVLMLWGYVFWIGLGVPGAVLHPLPAADQLAPALKAKIPQAGVYLWPNPPTEHVLEDPKQLAAYASAFRQGPIVHLFYLPDGINPVGITIFARGLLHFFASSWLAGWLLAMIGPRRATYRSLIGFVLLLGVFAAVFVNLSPPIWFQHPWGYHLVLAAFDCFNALLMGIVLGAIIKPLPGATGSLEGK
jgi:hypothetical protein